MKAPKINPKSKVQDGRRKNGGKRPGAGRPPVQSQEERSAIERAKSRGRSALPDILGVQERIALDPEKWGATAASRAAEFVASRCGLPTEQRVTGSSDGSVILALVTSLKPGALEEYPD